jgi:hypothetical protein
VIAQQEILSRTFKQWQQVYTLLGRELPAAETFLKSGWLEKKTIDFG